MFTLMVKPCHFHDIIGCQIGSLVLNWEFNLSWFIGRDWILQRWTKQGGEVELLIKSIINCFCTSSQALSALSIFYEK